MAEFKNHWSTLQLGPPSSVYPENGEDARKRQNWDWEKRNPHCGIPGRSQNIFMSFFRHHLETVDDFLAPPLSTEEGLLCVSLLHISGCQCSTVQGLPSGCNIINWCQQNSKVCCFHLGYSPRSAKVSCWLTRNRKSRRQARNLFVPFSSSPSLWRRWPRQRRPPWECGRTTTALPSRGRCRRRTATR